ncbi:MAG: helix-turn-helix domain containing protein [Sphaerochaetaceae bacterium]|nr:helix-turn-helix domain containing protein [Sphaerochaetaceae bacterium]
MRKRIDLFSKIRAILEHEAGIKTYPQIGRELGITRQAVMYWVKNKEVLFQEAQNYGILGIDHMLTDLALAEMGEPVTRGTENMPEHKNEESEATIIKSLREENIFLKNKLLYFEKLMESYGVDASKTHKKKDIRLSETVSKPERKV